MNKRLFIAIASILVMAFLLSLSAPSLQAQGATSVKDMARYFPDTVAAFASIRIDESYIDQLDNLLQIVLAPVEATVPQVTLRQAFTTLTGKNADDMLVWLGDYASVGFGKFDYANYRPELLYAVIELDDANAAREFIRQTFPDLTERTLNEYTLFLNPNASIYYAGAVEIIGNTLVFSSRNQGIGEFPSHARLVDDSFFRDAVDALPATDYNAVVFLGQSWIDEIAKYSSARPLNELLPNITIESAPVAAGLTFLDGNTLTLDSVQLPAGNVARPQPIDPAFMRFIPADADAVIHATNPAALYTNTAATMNDIALRMFGTNDGGYLMWNDPSNQDIPAEFESFVSRWYGIDLRNDILNWATGDYAFFARADIMPIAETVLQNEFNFDGRYDIGLIVEATDPGAAQAFANRLGRTILRMAPPGIEIAGEQVNGINVTRLSASASLPNGRSIPLNLMMGATEELFFLATPRAVQSITANGASLLDLPEYRDYERYFLPNPTMVWYSNSEGFIVGAVANPASVVAAAALLGPTIGNIFYSITNELGTPMPTPTPTPTPTPVPINVQLQPLRTVLNSVHGSSITSTVNEDGVTFVRITLTVIMP